MATFYPFNLILPLSLAGLAISAYVWSKQRSGRPIACWTKDCDRVIRSPYSRLLGVHNSAVGCWVFLLIFLITLLDPWPGLTSLTVVALSLIGLLVSLYLTYIQLFVLKGICNWCIASGVIVLAIFVLAVGGR